MTFICSIITLQQQPPQMLHDNNSNQFLVALLEQNIRLDGRECFQPRTISISFMDQSGIPHPNSGALLY